MGRPGLMPWLDIKYNDYVVDKISESCDYFAIDLNCKIHPTCFRVINSNPTISCLKELQLLQIKAIINDIDNLIQMVNPLIGVYIATDGVCPVAKMKQQRYRRFKSISDKTLWDNIKKKHNNFNESSVFWNNSAITPGTKFMEKLHLEILKYVKNSDKNIIYSSCYSPSEGEHKILQFIKLNINNSYVIYGLDADLIFLSLSSQCENIFLLRESNEINPKSKSTDFKYIKIELMKNYIFKIIQTKIIYPLNKKNIINDFIFICYFLGNDFLPELNSIDIYDSKIGIDYLLNTYSIVIKQLEYKYLINNDSFNIDMDFFSNFIKILADDENMILKERYYKSSIKNKFIANPYDREIYKIENLLFKIDDPIKLGYDDRDTKLDKEGWRERYYKYNWDVSADELENFSKSVVEHYLKGLKWMTLYYFDKIPSWDWYFPFDFPPLMHDIHKYLININNIPLELSYPMKPFMQLLTVLPPQSYYLLPETFHKIITNPKSSLAYLYPIKFEQNFINKKKHWMGIPILPPMDINLIKYIHNKYTNELSEEDLVRNKTI